MHEEREEGKMMMKEEGGKERDGGREGGREREVEGGRDGLLGCGGIMEDVVYSF